MTDVFQHGSHLLITDDLILQFDDSVTIEHDLDPFIYRFNLKSLSIHPAECIVSSFSRLEPVARLKIRSDCQNTSGYRFHLLLIWIGNITSIRKLPNAPTISIF